MSIVNDNLAILSNATYTVYTLEISERDVTMGFKTNLKTLIIKRANETGNIITQKEIFEATGISQATLSRWFKGDVEKLDYDTTLKLAQFFNCDLCDLVSMQATVE